MSGLDEAAATDGTFAWPVPRSAGDSAISTAELRRRLTDPDLTIVDVRALAAYNGWRTQGEARGGHIPRAAAFPSAWLTSIDDAEVVRLLHSKDIVSSRE